jgi:hypothetical protein
MALKLFSFALATSTLLPPITAQNASQAYIYGYAPAADNKTVYQSPTWDVWMLGK